MPVVVEKISVQDVRGWGYDELNPGNTLTVQIRLHGEIVGQASIDRPLPNQAGVDGGQRRGFVAPVSKLSNIVSALAEGNLAIVAQSKSTIVEGSTVPISVTFSRHLLSLQTLCSAQDLFGCAKLDEVLDRLEVIERRIDTGPQLPAFCCDVINFIRAFFPSETRGTRFYALAAELSRKAGMTHAAMFYEQRLNNHLASETVTDCAVFDAEVLGEDQVASYAQLGDLVRFADAPEIDLALPPFITGFRDASFLVECGIVPESDAERQAVRTYGFRVNGFGDQDWVVNYAGESVLVAEKLYRVDFEALRLMIDTGGILILDMTAEGPPCLPKWTVLLNSALRDLGLRPRQVLLVTQNLAFAPMARKEGLQACATTAHYYLKRGSDIANEHFGSDAKMLDYIGSILSRRAASVDAKKYVCLNYTPRWVRWAVVLSLYTHGHIDTGYVSFPGIRNKKLDVKIAQAYSLPPIRNRERYLTHVESLLARCPLVVDVDSGSWPAPEFVFPTKAFENSFLHIVTETEMTEGSVRRVTEKLIKPVFGLQPFLVAGNPGSLQLMRDLGFRTFGSIFDERYDAIAGITDRFDAMEEQMLLLLDQNLAALKRVTDQAVDILVHNFVHLVRTAPLLFGPAVEARLRAMVAAMVRRPEQ
jgi:hypothetical protein